MDIRFDGQTAIVTGSNSQMGVGYYYAKLLAERGAKVMMVGRSEEKIKAAAASLSDLGLDVDYAVADNTDEQALMAVVKKTADQWGRIDILINNAGGSDAENWPDFTMESILNIFYVNTFSSMIMMREVWPYMKEQGYGRIINTSSNSSFGGYSVCGYPISKAALVGLVKETSILGAADNILVNGVYPMAWTQMTNLLPPCDFAEKLESNYGSELLAPAVVFLCSKENTSYTGEMYSVGGGGYARVQTMATDFMACPTLEETEQTMKAAHAQDVAFKPINSAFEDMVNLGMPVEALQSLFTRDDV